MQFLLFSDILLLSRVLHFVVCIGTGWTNGVDGRTHCATLNTRSTTWTLPTASSILVSMSDHDDSDEMQPVQEMRCGSAIPGRMPRRSCHVVRRDRTPWEDLPKVQTFTPSRDRGCTRPRHMISLRHDIVKVSYLSLM